MNIDQEYLKKLEENIINRVHQEVEQRLFRKYLAMGAFVAAVTGFFGWSVISGIEKKAADIAQTAAKPAILATENAISKTNESASLANTVAETAALRVSHFDAFIKAREEILLSIQEDTNRQTRLAKLMQGETRDFFTAAKDEAEALSVQYAQMADDFESYQRKTDTVANEAVKFASKGEMETVANTIDVLATQLAAMNNQLSELITVAATTNPLQLSETGANAREIDNAISDVSSVAGSVSGQTTVYFQFAGSTRGVVETIAARLGDLNYIMPGEERTSIAASKKEIRFFYEEDRARAKALVMDGNAILRSMALEDGLQVRDFSLYSGPKPRRGTIELWLEPVPLG